MKEIITFELVDETNELTMHIGSERSIVIGKFLQGDIGKLLTLSGDKLDHFHKLILQAIANNL